MCWFYLPDYRIVRRDYPLGSSRGALCQSVETILKPKSRQQTIATRLQLMAMRLITCRQKHTNDCCQIFTHTTAIFTLGKKPTIPWTTTLDNLTKAICRTSSFVCLCENKTERCFSLLNGVTLYVQGISVCQQICAEEKDTAEADWTKCFT